MQHFINHLPKAELHVHLLGTLQPEQVLMYAKRNNISTIYKTIEQIKQAYNSFDNLSSFLTVYKNASQVIRTERDFYELLYSYLQQLYAQHVLHAEIFFEVQTFQPMGVNFETIITGLHKAKTDAQKQLGIQCDLLLCFLRDRPQEEALNVLEESLKYRENILGIGLASNEHGYPPSKFIELYQQAKKYGYKLCVHGGEEEGPDYIWQALELLHADRIDHGVTCMQDQMLVDYLVKTQTPLTVCLLSNIKLNIFSDIKKHPIKKMLEAGLLVSINSDDPAFFGTLSDNFIAANRFLTMNKEQLILCVRNAFCSSFISDEQKQKYLKMLELYEPQTID